MRFWVSSGFLGGMESVRRESWRVARRDSVERLVSGYNIIGRCGERECLCVRMSEGCKG